MLDVNEYFDGRVKSIGFQTETLPATVGVMTPGDYRFDTRQPETMTVVSGSLVVRLPDSENWQTFNAGDSFEVAANKMFDLQVKVDTAYFCTYG